VWKPVLAILFGAAFTVTVSLALGSLLLRRLRVTLDRWEAILIAFVAGSACLSLVTFFLCLIHAARWEVFLAAGWLAILIWHGRAGRHKSIDCPVWPLLILVPFAVVYFINALAPEVSPDGSGYHLGNVLHYWRAHGFDWAHHSMYASMPQGAEMLFLFAFCFGGHSSAALVHFAFLAALPLLIARYGARIASPRAGLFAAVLVFTCPVAGITGASAYNDLALATVVFAVFLLLQVWNEMRDSNLLWLIGLLAGFAYAIKYTGALALPFALAFLPWRSWWRALVPAGVMIGSWALRNWIWLGNPFAPFLNRWFPNPWFYVGAEQSYLADQRHYIGLQHWWEVPLQLAFRGGKIPGIVGPVFLLAPLALLALRWRHGRRLLLAALVFALPALANIDSRFLIPALPFLALALGLALANSWGVLPALAAFETLVCWPPVLAMYCDDWAWRLRETPIRAALRMEPEAAFLARHVHDYSLKAAIEQAVPRDEKIFSFAGRAEAYLDREIVVGYESAFGNRLQDALLTLVGNPPVDRERFRFPPVRAKGVRVIETVAGPDDWTVAEMRLLAGGRELARSPEWRLTAWPHPAEAAMAFDGNAATRWSTWGPMRPGDRLEAVFPRSETLDEVVLECMAARGAQLDLEYLSEDGRWRSIGTRSPAPEPQPLAPTLRLDPTRAVKAQGIRYLLVDDSDYSGPDMKQNLKLWGLTEVAQANGTHLYRID